MPWKASRPDEVPPFMCVSCHDWACNCTSPYTVKRYTFGHTPRTPALDTTIYERGYMFPHGSKLDKNNNIVAKMPPVIRGYSKTSRNNNGAQGQRGALKERGQVSQEDDSTSYSYINGSEQSSIKSRSGVKKNPLRANQQETYNWSLSRQPRSANSSAVSNTTFVKSEDADYSVEEEDEVERRLEEKYNSPEMMEAMLSSKPLSVKREFMVSGPHWASKGHTQQWPWRGGVKPKLWASNHNIRPSTSACNRNYWNIGCNRKRAAWL